MADIIQLLPDHVANQIAAGEVIQRPASIVKELLENSVDAGAKSIQLIIKDAGRSLVQVIDNGCGMSETDARLSFERHATSKIRNADDLFAIRSMGFRGEAMASIAAVAQVELKTKLHDQELGTLLKIEGSKVIAQTPCQCASGTNTAVKNLFFNVPARRNFLKSNPVELRHIIEEFCRVALAFPQISFSLINNDQETYRLPVSSLKQRIIGLMGNSLNEKLLTINEQTNIINISGFVGKPDAAKKNRGEQYLFINNRFFKSSYLNHAVQSAMLNLINPETFPPFFIFFEIDPAQIDINIHPTKTEIKFTDEKSIYAILRSAVKKAIGQHILSPLIDFDGENTLSIPIPKKADQVKTPDLNLNSEYNPFNSNTKLSGSNYNNALRQWPKSDWETITGEKIPEAQFDFENAKQEQLFENSELEPELQVNQLPYLLHRRFLITQVKSGMMLIDVQGALARIAYERLMKSAKTSGNSQQLLFPFAKDFSGPDFELLMALKDEMRQLGFNMEHLGDRTITFNGLPTELNASNPEDLIDDMLAMFKQNQQNIQLSRMEIMAKGLAFNLSKSQWKKFNNEQSKNLIDSLFACEIPNLNIDGKSIVNIMSLEEISQNFNKH